MAYAQLSATRVRDAAELALQELKRDTAAGSSGDQRAELTRIRWLLQLAAASMQEDDTHRYVTVTAIRKASSSSWRCLKSARSTGSNEFPRCVRQPNRQLHRVSQPQGR